MNDKPDELPDEDPEDDDEQAPEPPSPGAEPARRDAQPVGEVASADGFGEEPEEWAPEPPPVAAAAGPGDRDATPAQSGGEAWADPDEQAPEPPLAGARQDHSDVALERSAGEAWEETEYQAPEPPSGAAGPGAGDAEPVAEQHGSFHDGGGWPEEQAPEPPGADLGDEHPASSAEQPPEFEPMDSPEPGSESAELPGDARSEWAEDDAPEPPRALAEDGSELSASHGWPEQTSVGFPDEAPSHDATPSDVSPDDDQESSANDPLATTDGRPLSGNERPMTAADGQAFAGEVDSIRDASSSQPLGATEATSADSFDGAATRGAVSGARERPSPGGALFAGDVPPAGEMLSARDALSSPGDGTAGYDSRTAIREARQAAREARLEQAVGLPPEPSETPQFRWADADNRQAVNDAAGADRTDQGDLLREDPAISEASTEVLRQFGSAMSEYPNPKVQAVGQALEAAGTGLDVVNGWLAGRQHGAAEAINAGLDQLVDEVGGGEDPNVQATMDSLKDHIRTIISAQAPALNDEYDQPPLIRGDRRERNES